MTCDYLLMTGHRRPCPGGKDCTVKKTEGDGNEMPRRSTFDKSRARELLAAGWSVADVATELGATVAAIRQWRRRAGIPVERTPRSEADPADTPQAPAEAKAGPLEGFLPLPLTRRMTAASEPAEPGDNDEAEDVPEPSVPTTTNEPDEVEQEDERGGSPEGGDDSPGEDMAADEDPPAGDADDKPPAEPPVDEEDPIYRLLRFVRDAADPVEVSFSFRGCSVKLRATCLSQASAVADMMGALVKGFSTVPTLDTD